MMMVEMKSRHNRNHDKLSIRQNSTTSTVFILLLLFPSILIHVCNGNVHRGGSAPERRRQDNTLDADAATANPTATHEVPDQDDDAYDDDDMILVDDDDYVIADDDDNSEMMKTWEQQEREEQQERQRDLQSLPSLKNYGANPNRHPLYRCEGDCDRDSEYVHYILFCGFRCRSFGVTYL